MKRKRLLFVALADLESVPYAESALPALARDGWEVTVAAVEPQESVLRKVFPYPCETVNLGSGTGWRRLRREVRTWRVLLRARFGSYDVVYMYSSGLAPRSFPWLAGPLGRKRLVYQTHDYVDPLRYRWHAFWEGWLARRAALHLNGEYHRGYLCRAQYRLRCPVVIAPPNLPAAWIMPARCGEIRSRLAGGATDAFVLISHGGYLDLRMTRELLQALSQLPRRFRLAMTNAAHPCAELDSLLEELALRERVVRLPKMPFQEVFSYTVNADAGVLLYANNDLGNFFQAPGRLTQYLACGLPVVASRFTGLESLVLRYGLGECVDAANPRSISAGLLRLEEAVLAGRVSRAAMRAAFERHFAFEHWETRITRAFNELLDPRRDRSVSGPPVLWFPGDRESV